MTPSVAAVFNDKFWFCGSMLYPDKCYFINPDQKGAKTVIEAKGRILTRSISPLSSNYGRHSFVSNNKLNILQPNPQIRTVDLSTMNEDPDDDWDSWRYEDPLWEYEFRNESFVKEYFSTGMFSMESLLPYDTFMNDFYPIPDRKGVLFVAVFRYREFDEKPFKPAGCKQCPIVPRKNWTKAEYFIILYRYVFGRFIRLSRMETNFRYESKLRGFDLKTPIFKDVSALESDGDIILLSNSESEYFKLIFDEETKETELEGFEIPGIKLIAA
ncbi:Oidioi.mRNA.OKI2018_I69.chr2.g4686.t1.cds [Oikopleura dioica]|uniref:Oidioi.mRNA.OKI2018_I69.chr2.g4686.t1.cds n=1 Tax=Oikopleura dioica TaxID=34765 RepID=A0ABN7T4P4_OIKDI|nr:Oidioi.mRNA.OKI2018_I69.chr2.g4686.t1.cds [Oikopleura dioica]